MCALQYISHWQKPRGNANAAPAFAPAEAVEMGERDFWYHSESRCEHSSAGCTVRCLPGTWEALGCGNHGVSGEQNSPYTGWTWTHLCRCCWALLHHLLSRRNIFHLHHVRQLLVKGYGSSVIHSLSTERPHVLLFYRKLFSARRQPYQERKLKKGANESLKSFLIHHNTWSMQHVSVSSHIAHNPSPSLGYYIWHRHKHH